LKELRRSANSGQLNWRKCVEILDADVFKSKALLDRVPEEEIAKLKQQLKGSMRAVSANALAMLATTFRVSAQSNIGLGDFTSAIRGIGISPQAVSNTALRSLFNSFDSTGSGMISLEKFLTDFKGGLSPSRQQLIAYAFQKINRTGFPTLSIDEIAENYSPSCHPDVLLGLKSERGVMKDLLHSLNVQVFCSTYIVCRLFFLMPPDPDPIILMKGCRW
jgi:hypothetical protein